MLAIILEMIAQAVKARNEAERQARIEYARNNPADYLRRFGRVREINANDTNTESGSVRSGKAVIDVVHVDGHFVIADDDMGKLTGYIAALEAGCTAPK
ncbi:hypothetical protein CX680_18490 [Klebsiella pneumoniae]|nr:hypothetical protein CX680_18225 [Klebsiella pneumoniae]PKS25116.1 hypothetical protein CX680_18490 [Klebsiella pneumoniae]